MARRPFYFRREAVREIEGFMPDLKICGECHTPRDSNDLPIMSQAFEGGRVQRERPTRVISSNLTPDATGIAGWNVDDLVRVLREGRGQTAEPLCEPMVVSGMSLFSQLSASDATDIAHYLLSLPPAAHEIHSECGADSDAGR